MEDSSGEIALRLEAILESCIDGVVAIDQLGTIEYMNAAALDMFGYESGELVGEKVNLLMPSPDREHHDEYMARYLETGIARVMGLGREVVGLRKDGSEFPHFLAISEGTHQGKTIFTGIVRDLTELRLTEDRAKSAEQLASLSVITAGVAHDIGTPMNVILGYADMLSDSLDNPKDRRRAAVISEQVRRVTDLLQTLLNIARPQTAMRSPLQIEQILEHALEFFREKLAAREIAVVRHFEKVPSLIGDRDRLEQALLNLIVNAADAMSTGGRLSVSVESREPGWIELEIGDTGHGMDAEALERIFDPFFTTKERGKGTGLGLVVTKSIVSDHRGTIVCQSDLGKGTRFLIRFPTSTNLG